MVKNGLMSIRRCSNCNYKTHRRLWHIVEKEERCPVCDLDIGYSESDHGGLNKRQIEEAKRKLVATERELLPESDPQRFFLSRERR